MSTAQTPLRVGIVVGSLRRDSINRKLAQALTRLAPAHLQFHFLEMGQLPLYNQDDDAQPHPTAVQFKKEVSDSQALLFVTPEYNRSIPGVLKNALDHASRPYGKNAWAGKPAGVIGASIGSIGSALAQQHLRNVLAYLDVPTLGQPEAFIHVKDDFFDAQGGIANEGNRAFLQAWVDAYVAWITRHQP